MAKWSSRPPGELRSLVRIPPGFKVFRCLYTLQCYCKKINTHCHCVYLRKINASKKELFLNNISLAYIHVFFTFRVRVCNGGPINGLFNSIGKLQLARSMFGPFITIYKLYSLNHKCLLLFPLHRLGFRFASQKKESKIELT
jgi:hypothetical protein